MLGKLIKYDLKYLLKNMSVFYILTFVFVVTTRILSGLEQTVFIEILKQISVGALIAMVANILFNTVIRSWVRFKSSIYGDEAYLIHTLPMTKAKIYGAKFLEALIFIFVGFAISVISLFMAFYTPDGWVTIENVVNSMSSSLGAGVWSIVIVVGVILFLEIFNIIQAGFLGIIFGHRKNHNKVAFSFLFGFVGYVLSQIFVVLCLLVLGIFNSNVMEIFTSMDTLGIDIIWTIIIFAILAYLTAIVLTGFICAKMLNKGVDVD